jgi:5'-phosphate synthase pdxT subunit
VLFGTCAGLILLATEVTHPHQQSLGLLDVSVERNAYGRQIDSFVGRGTLRLPERDEEETEMVFIRAPRIRRVGPGVQVLGRWGEEPVMVRRGAILAATFHPEMSAPPPGGSPVHRFFLEVVRRTSGREGEDR